LSSTKMQRRATRSSSSTTLVENAAKVAAKPVAQQAGPKRVLGDVTNRTALAAAHNNGVKKSNSLALAKKPAVRFVYLLNPHPPAFFFPLLIHTWSDQLLCRSKRNPLPSPLPNLPSL